ncbi:MAG: heme exporter protein CcmB [Neomegalonema sp.]|nr:heme exporter protein CcmB [Neomegalonema sp.]
MTSIFWRDLALAFRIGGGAGQALVFFLLAVTLLAFGTGGEPDVLRSVAPGALWVFALLSCLLSLDRLFQADVEDGSMDGLMLASTPLEAVVLAKAAAHWVTTGLPMILAAPILAALLNLEPAAYGMLILSLAIGTPALSLIGAIGAALTASVRRGGMLLSLLVLPLYIPTLVAGAMAVRASAAGFEAWPYLGMLSAITLGCAALAPFASAAALRITLS